MLLNTGEYKESLGHVVKIISSARSNAAQKASAEMMSSAMPSGEVNSYDSYGAPNWEKNTYLRLKSVTLGYDLSRLFKADKLKVRFYFSGQNLLTFTGYKGLDPEVENDRASYPQQKTFSFGLDVKF